MLLFGLAIGLQHAFEPDHIAALSTQSSKRTKQSLRFYIGKSSLVGALWGAGHTTTLVLVGLVTFFLAISIHQQIFSGFEMLVGIMLVVLGTTTIMNKKFKILHFHPHRHSDGTVHFGAHKHNDSDHRHGHKAYIIGLIHGLAGSGALLALTAASFSDTSTMLLYVVTFGLGSMLGMSLVSILIGLPLGISKNAKIQKFFKHGTGLISIILGIFIIFEMYLQFI